MAWIQLTKHLSRFVAESITPADRGCGDLYLMATLTFDELEWSSRLLGVSYELQWETARNTLLCSFRS